MPVRSSVCLHSLVYMYIVKLLVSSEALILLFKIRDSLWKTHKTTKHHLPKKFHIVCHLSIERSLGGEILAKYKIINGKLL